MPPLPPPDPVVFLLGGSYTNTIFNELAPGLIQPISCYVPWSVVCLSVVPSSSPAQQKRSLKLHSCPKVTS